MAKGIAAIPDSELELESFGKDELVRVRQSDDTPFMTIAKTGNMRLSRGLVKLLDLKAGAGILFLRDKRESSNWFVMREDGSGLVLRDAQDGILQISSASLRIKLLSSMEFNGETEDISGTVNVSTTPIKSQGRVMYAVLTSSFKQSNRKSKA